MVQEDGRRNAGLSSADGGPGMARRIPERASTGLGMFRGALMPLSAISQSKDFSASTNLDSSSTGPRRVFVKTRQTASARMAGTESKKRKREDEVPTVITFHTPSRTFDRVFRGEHSIPLACTSPFASDTPYQSKHLRRQKGLCERSLSSQRALRFALFSFVVVQM